MQSVTTPTKRLRIMVDMSATLIHHGHIRLLRKAAELGDVVVALTSDAEVKSKKGYTPEMNYRALTDSVSRNRSPSFSVCPISRTDTGRFMRPPLALSCFFMKGTGPQRAEPPALKICIKKLLPKGNQSSDKRTIKRS